ncbi:MAG: tRNA lysidine(34) synthetase TilS [Thermosulfidibacteraceae bacterium]|jgi:tRNA(Ile)-lysidine synthase
MQTFRVSFVGKIKRTIERFGLIEKGDRIITAVSGGPDSVALLLSLYELREKIGFELALCHFRHGVRPNDFRDVEFTRDLASKFNLPFFLGEGDASSFAKERGMSLEEACRFLRYSYFEELLKREGYDKVALGHTLSDNVETFFMRILKGSSLSGLKGIPPKRGFYIRPLIEVTREDVLDFLKEVGVNFIVDETNFSERFFRNWVRLRLIPFLTGKVPSLNRIVGRVIELLREDEDYMSNIASKVIKALPIEKRGKNIYFKIDENFIQLHPAIKRRVIAGILYENFYRGEPERLMSEKMSKLLKIFGSMEGSKEFKLSGGIVLRREYEKVFIGYPESRNAEKKEVLVVGSGVYHIGDWIFNVRDAIMTEENLLNVGKFVAVFSKEKVRFPLIFRMRKEGDRIMIREGLTKKVKEFFIDKKVPYSVRDKIPLLVDSEGRVIWIVGYIQNMELLPKKDEEVIIFEARRYEGTDR